MAAGFPCLESSLLCLAQISHKPSSKSQRTQLADHTWVPCVGKYGIN